MNEKEEFERFIEHSILETERTKNHNKVIVTGGEVWYIGDTTEESNTGIEVSYNTTTYHVLNILTGKLVDSKTKFEHDFITVKGNQLSLAERRYIDDSNTSYLFNIHHNTFESMSYSKLLVDIDHYHNTYKGQVINIELVSEW